MANVKTNNVVAKAKSFLALSKMRQCRFDARRDLGKAIECLQFAMEQCNAAGDLYERKRIESELSYLQFKYWAGVDDAKANSFFIAALSRESQSAPWRDFIADALSDQIVIDYQLLLWGADRALAEANDDASRAIATVCKGDIYFAMRKFDHAVAVYGRVLDDANISDYADVVDKYARALSELQSGVNSLNSNVMRSNEWFV